MPGIDGPKAGTFGMERDRDRRQDGDHGRSVITAEPLDIKGSIAVPLRSEGARRTPGPLLPSDQLDDGPQAARRAEKDPAALADIGDGDDARPARVEQEQEQDEYLPTPPHHPH